MAARLAGTRNLERSREKPTRRGVVRVERRVRPRPRKLDDSGLGKMKRRSLARAPLRPAVEARNGERRTGAGNPKRRFRTIGFKETQQEGN